MCLFYRKSVVMKEAEHFQHVYNVCVRLCAWSITVCMQCCCTDFQGQIESVSEEYLLIVTLIILVYYVYLAVALFQFHKGKKSFYCLLVYWWLNEHNLKCQHSTTKINNSISGIYWVNYMGAAPNLRTANFRVPSPQYFWWVLSYLLGTIDNEMHWPALVPMHKIITRSVGTAGYRCILLQSNI